MWIFGAEVVSDWGQHCDKAAVPVRQRKNKEFVKNVLSVGDGGKKPVDVILVDALGEKCDDSEEVTRVGAEAAKYGGSKRELDGRGKALIVICPEILGPLDVPLLRNSIVIPHVVGCGESEESY